MSKEDIKKFFRKEIKKVNYLTITLLIVGIVGISFLVSSLSFDSGVSTGYEKAIKEQVEQQEKSNYYSLEYSDRKEYFWSSIIYDVMNNTTAIFMVLTIVLILWALMR